MKSEKYLSLFLIVALILGLASVTASAAPVDMSGVKAVMPELVVRRDNPQPDNSTSPLYSPTLASSTIVWFGGYQWVVIGWDGKGVACEPGKATLFFADANTVKPPTTAFNPTTNYTNIYANSSLQTAMLNFYNSLPPREKNNIAPRNLAGDSGLFSYSFSLAWYS